MYLSEYDNVDRRILYQKKSCATSGVEIVPMTITELAYDSEWIIAKSERKRNNLNIEYWIIKNKYQIDPDAETIKANRLGPLDKVTFKIMLKEKAIVLELKRIE